jgi:shikimate kinase
MEDGSERAYEDRALRRPVLYPPPALFLVGYRGSGKSTVARLLAGRLGWAWVDADDVLEERAGRPIRAVFADEGEAGFRDREAAVLADLCRLRRHVVATGGGVVLRAGNRDLMRWSGLVVWLAADPETLWQRVQGDDSTAERRPALTVGGRGEVEQVLRAREPLYRACADLTVQTAGRVPEEVADEILTALSGSLGVWESGSLGVWESGSLGVQDSRPSGQTPRPDL